MAILSKNGVLPEMEFKCTDCGDITTGLDIANGTYLYIIQRNKENPEKSLWRCECCQDDRDDRD